MSLVPYRDWAMTPGTRESASSSPNPLTDRSSVVESFVTASGVVRMDAGDRVAATVTFGSACAESGGVGRCAIARDVTSDGSSRQAMRTERMDSGVGRRARDSLAGVVAREDELISVSRGIALRELANASLS